MDEREELAALRRMAELEAKAGGQPVEQPQELSGMQQIGRQAGRTGRMLLEGVGDVAGIVGNPLAAITGARRPSEIASDVATRLGLPENVSESERLSGSIGRGVVGAGSMVGAGGLLAKAPSFIGQAGKFFSAQPVAQLTSAAGGAGGAELARQSGAGVGGQIAAGLLGGIAPTGLAKGAPYIGGKVADVIGGIGTHTGGESMRQAAQSGQRSGLSVFNKPLPSDIKAAESFRSALRGKSNMTDVLDDVRANIAEMGKQKMQAYRQGMADVSKDKQVLDFGGIDKSMKNAYDIATYKGQIKNVKAAKSLQEAYDAISQWKSLNPAEYHTPEGMDALKQNIGGILESIPFEEKTARSAVGQIYNSIKNEINKQAPVYSGVMKDYAESTETIREIERALSAGQKASSDTSMRKLQSLMRNNASTNYGNRLEIAKQMEQQGGREIMPALAGQALSSATPRGLGSIVTGGVGGYGLATMNPAVLPVMATTSPRLMGEAAYYTGKLSNLAKPLAPLAYNQDEALQSAALQSLLYSSMGANQ